MSKIQKAIDRASVARDSSSESLSGQTDRHPLAAGRRATDKSNLIIPVLAKAATKVSLDSTILEKNRVVKSSDATAAAASYKMLRTRLLHQLRSNKWHSIAVTSARRNAGKTLTSINTAISLSSEPNQRVILVDLDLRRPSLVNTLGINVDLGVTDYLRNEATLEEIVIQTDIERLLLVPSGSHAEDSSELLSTSRMADLVKIVTSRLNSTIVLFDLPPVLEADDLLAFSPLIDCLLVVAAEGETRRSDIQKSIDLINEFDVLGLVLNKSRSDHDTTGYYI